MQGYYSGFGLNVTCNGNQDSCYVYCKNTGCVNLNLMCINDNGKCAIVCTNSDDKVCEYSLKKTTKLETPLQYDIMLFKIDGIISKISNSTHSILPTNWSYTDYTNYKANCSTKGFDKDGYKVKSLSLSDINGNICCLGESTCEYSQFIETGITKNSSDVAKNIYCHGYGACEHITITFVTNDGDVYVRGAKGAHKAVITFKSMVSCEVCCILNKILLYS